MDLYNLILGEISQKELLDYYNASIIYEKLPNTINGFVFNYDNINFILINDNLSYYKKRKTILHELAHIELNQLNQIDEDMIYLKVNRYEDEADRYVNFLIKCAKEEL